MTIRCEFDKAFVVKDHKQRGVAAFKANKSNIKAHYQASYTPRKEFMIFSVR